MRVGWLQDQVGYVGGAELTQAEFRAAAPDDVEIVDCPPGEVDRTCDRFVIHNCMTYTLDDLDAVGARPVIKYHHDVGPWLPVEVKAWLAENTVAVCCSPAQARHMGLNAHLIPPPVDLERFADAANGDRAGAVSVAAWRNHDKAPHRVAEWSVANDTPIDFYGGGQFAPPGSQEVAYEDMPALLASYERFVFLPTALEPFGRLVVEAWAAGCEVVTNDLVGAKYWLEDRARSIETAGADFWQTVLS